MMSVRLKIIKEVKRMADIPDLEMEIIQKIKK